MKKFIILFVAILISSVSIAQENWRSFNSELGKFSIEFLADVSISQHVSEKTTTNQTTFTTDNMTIFVYSVKHKAKVEGRNDLLKKSVDTFVNSVGGSIISTKEIEKEGVDGFYANMSLEYDSYYLEYKVYFKGNYQYQVIISSDKEYYIQETANRYFNTFKMED